MTEIELIYVLAFFFTLGLCSIGLIIREMNNSKLLDRLSITVSQENRKDEKEFIFVDDNGQPEKTLDDFVLVADNEEEQSESLFMT